MAWMRTSCSVLDPARSRAPSDERKACPAASPKTKATTTPRAARPRIWPGVTSRLYLTAAIEVESQPEAADSLLGGLVAGSRPVAGVVSTRAAVATVVGVVTAHLQGGGQGNPSPPRSVVTQTLADPSRIHRLPAARRSRAPPAAGARRHWALSPRADARRGL